jgi:hypothetical protein
MSAEVCLFCVNGYLSVDILAEYQSFPKVNKFDCHSDDSAWSAGLRDLFLDEYPSTHVFLCRGFLWEDDEFGCKDREQFCECHATGSGVVNLSGLEWRNGLPRHKLRSQCPAVSLREVQVRFRNSKF